MNAYLGAFESSAGDMDCADEGVGGLFPDVELLPVDLHLKRVVLDLSGGLGLTDLVRQTGVLFLGLVLLWLRLPHLVVQVTI